LHNSSKIETLPLGKNYLEMCMKFSSYSCNYV